MTHLQVTKWMIAASLTLAALVGCFPEGSGKLPSATSKGGGGGNGGSGATGGEIAMGEGGAGGEPPAPMCSARPLEEGAGCHPVTSAEPLRARVVDAVPQDRLVFTDVLWGQFSAQCGPCHVASNLGGFVVTRASFAEKVDESALAAIRSNSPSCERDDEGNKLDPSCFAFMPPAGPPSAKPWSERENNPNDSVTQLSNLIAEWIDQGSPLDAFTASAEATGSTASYGISAEFAETFTNIGTCIPDVGLFGTELEESCGMDERFAAMQKKLDSGDPNEQLGLPPTLDQTDLVTFDSAELARRSVIAYAPTYPLWSDDAGKLRHVRVPRGQAIRFNKKLGQFEIPKNTRFYKTFLKKILDHDGMERYRKIETRLIVSRPGEESLFGTYQWDEGESQATLVTEPLNSGRPFKDRLLTVVTDWPKADAIKLQWEAGEVRNYSRQLDLEGAVRRYAIPGSERCIQCHMGGVGQSFILGFSPVQVHSRPCDRATLEAEGHCEGGVIEPAEGDQLTQLERLVSYGVIEDYDIATQLVTLEDSQGPKGARRNYRTEEELTGQGYLLGNCAHCHNPDGYPSQLSPELKPLLNFLPEAGGGVFEFPLDRVSPRILRRQGTIQLPYITPSLRDIFATTEDWKPKELEVKLNIPGVDNRIDFIDAPWRSLIYRNVDTPFLYTDDSTIYPHMPLNTPGFDCRAPRILGEWMVSLPALRKNPQLSEDVPSKMPIAEDLRENDPQPYYEVKPGDPNYLNAVDKANKRLAAYRKGLRHKNYCPDTKDIVDVFGVLYATDGISIIPTDGAVMSLPRESVPDRSHWVLTDLTDPPGDWTARRTDWKDIIIDQNFTASEKALEGLFGPARINEEARIAQEKEIVAMLQGVQLDEAFIAFASKKVPFGLWQAKPDCDFSDVKKVGDFLGEAAAPRWIVDNKASLDASAPVYTEATPGYLVYNMICVNCHGVDADSRGRQATTLQEMTGGLGRVANFRDGFFGPQGSGGSNRDKLFGSDDVASRYLAWMALGGTRTRIPRPILDLVASTPVLGEARPTPPAVTSANMLTTARQLCRGLVTRGNAQDFVPEDMTKIDPTLRSLHKDTGLMLSNGDSELWASLCTYQNPAPIHGLRVEQTGSLAELKRKLSIYTKDLYSSSGYPAGTPVGNFRGKVAATLSPDNDFPWCIIPPPEPELLAWANEQKDPDGKPLPLCPDGFLTEENHWENVSEPGAPPVMPDLEQWAARGAINAGLAVYVYLDGLIGDGEKRPLAFSECEKLKGAAP